jgi:2-dehydro-3-deoxyphosphogluconate aldolase/(4S)-4-hydroxy-2-oxoglutarate aldolase
MQRAHARATNHPLRPSGGLACRYDTSRIGMETPWPGGRRPGRENAVEEIFEHLWELGIVPVSSIPSPEVVPELGDALLAGGLPVVEIAFRTPVAVAAVAEFSHLFPQIMLGAGTVLTTQQAEVAVSAGAQFIVSPGFGPEVVAWCADHGVPIIPGVATPTEIQRAMEKGLELLKFFPAEVLGGTRALRALADPFGQVKFMPTGGINAGNLAQYLGLPSVHCCGGSWLAPRPELEARDFARIRNRVSEAVALVRMVRGERAGR